MLTFILVIWIISRILRPRYICRHYCYRPFFGLGWGLPLLGMYLLGRHHRPHADHCPDGWHGCGYEGFGQPHGGDHGFGGQGGWW